MNTTLLVLINIVIMLGIVFGLIFLKKRNVSFTVRVLLAMGLGIVFGAILQLTYGATSDVVQRSNSWFAIIGTGYVRLLRMVVIPLIFVSIISAIINQDSKNLGKMATQIIAILMITTAISALIAAGTASIFNLSAEGLQSGEAEQQAGENLETRLEDYQSKPIQEQIVEIIPINPFYAMTGQESSSTLSVVLFAALLSIATIGIKTSKPESAETFKKLIQSLHDVVMRLVTMILRLTPFGVLALMTRMVSTSNFSEILRLINFVIASYVALIVVMVVHLIILGIFGLNPMTYLKKAATPLMFGFSSRSSAGTLPINIETQIDKLGVPKGHANLSASLGTSIGQNGCAGVYPAMLAVMIAPTVGINPLAPAFLIKLIIVTALASFGIAGVGGGATFAALTVLSAMGLPVGLVGLLIAIEPLIDMGRTLVNVSGSMVAGLVSSKMMGELDMEVYNSTTTGK
ncbi:L-cystine transporter [Wansuia hejianensis]|uniref:L-cystine uptake protein TcyP n=1 Tax=Wansuia hejianensis TaxID=2763667 RepID=A0A926EYZ1_9FIRM|nr:cation:dicarboxylase symporter family transporter [Wansuia hejianensis]MBC8590948.1 cation:dicarboxylase symporter family transporter [Wansuia hejianensis]